MNKLLSEGDRGKCTGCGSYVLVMFQSEAIDGEWGACAMFKKIVDWDGGCSHWWEWQTRGMEEDDG